ncbi:MAG: Ig-like domain-containing protein, partial [Candidatus Bipolaricaulaceae bacterium]
PAPTSGNNVWQLGDLAPNAQVTITISGTVDPAVLGTLRNTAAVASDTTDPSTGNNTVQEDTVVQAWADLRITKRALPQFVPAGGLLSYDLEIFNDGPSAGHAVVVTEDYPEWFTFMESVPAPDSGTVNRWTFALLPPYSRVSIRIIGQVSRFAWGHLTNYAVVTSASTDPDPSDNDVTLVTDIDTTVIAEDDVFELVEDSTLEVSVPGVLANDYYPEGLCSLRLVEGPEHGTLQLNMDGSFTYTPKPDFYGRDGFVYEICDCDDDCDTAEVTLEVLCLNDPVRGENISVRTCMNDAINIDLVAYDADILADGFQDHPLTFEVLYGPQHGTLAGDWTSVTYSTGQAAVRVIYVPDLNFVGEDTFLVRVSDLLGDTTYIRVHVEVDDCGRRPLGGAGELLLGPVVIHEIAWTGTATSPEDQWIELMNVTNEPVDLAGWVLRWRKKEPKTEMDLIWREIQLHGIIPAQGFFLLERGHDEVVRDTLADLVYPVAMRVGEREIPLSFSPEGDLVMLLNAAGLVVDTANADPRRPRGWAAGDFATKATMERKAPHLPDLDEHWWTNLGLVTKGFDRKGLEIRGTVDTLNEPELLGLQGPSLDVTRGEKITLTRAMPVAPRAVPRAVLIRMDVRGLPTEVLPANDRLEVRWDETLGLVSVVVDSTGLQVGTYHLVLLLDSPLVTRLNVR